ncbi:unnamed protein product, partial [Mesorhabditis spiculigera]
MLRASTLFRAFFLLLALLAAVTVAQEPHQDDDSVPVANLLTNEHFRIPAELWEQLRAAQDVQEAQPRQRQFARNSRANGKPTFIRFGKRSKPHFIRFGKRDQQMGLM